MATKKIRSANMATMSTLAPDLPRPVSFEDKKEYTLSLVHVDSLDSTARDAIYELFNSNMSAIQQSSSFPYTEASKREELFHPDTRYLLLSAPQSPQTTASTSSATSSSSATSPTIAESLPRPITSLVDPSRPQGAKGKQKGRALAINVTNGDVGMGSINSQLMGFCSFRFDTEETLSSRDAEVVYCYELQLSPATRGKGMGRLLIAQLEGIGRRRRLDKVMLTCLKRNQSALSFYTKQGYKPDEIDPTRMTQEEEWADEDEDEAASSDGDDNAESDEERREIDYIILSKDLK